MKDFELRIKVDGMENPNGLSVFDTKPKYFTLKEKEIAERELAMRKFIEAGKPHDWI